MSLLFSVKFGMPSKPIPPFSSRVRSGNSWILGDFSSTARNGLLHIISDAIVKDFVPSWAVVAKELQRIDRAAPKDYDPRSLSGISQARQDVEIYLKLLTWERAYDFCERLHGHLAQEAYVWRDEEKVLITKAEAQAFVADELQRLFDEENLGYEFSDGSVQRRGKRHTMGQISGVQATLIDQRLDSARTHFSKSLGFFRDRKQPDFENAVKEAVCAVEASAKELFPDSKAATLGDFLAWMAKSTPSLLPKPIDQTFSGLYGFRNSARGVSHGAASGGVVTAQLCEYVIAVAASQIVFLAALAEKSDEPPF